MVEQPETTIQTEDKHSISWGALILWPFLILFLYVLSAGPVAMMTEKGIISFTNEFVNKVYGPLGWAYDETPLHKPYGMYLHLWAPKLVDKNGEAK